MWGAIIGDLAGSIYKYEQIQGIKGALMRVSPVGYMFESEDEIRRNSRLATIHSHNFNEAISSAETISLIIFYARKGFSKKDIINKLKINLEYKPFESFNSTCSQTIDNCLYALFTSNSFEESLNKVISYGGDTDTNACIVGSMAEAMYGIDNDLINKAKRKIPTEFSLILDRAYKSKQRDEDEWERKVCFVLKRFIVDDYKPLFLFEIKLFMLIYVNLLTNIKNCYRIQTKVLWYFEEDIGGEENEKRCCNNRDNCQRK